MPRPPLPPGTHGNIKAAEVAPGVWRARCRYRDHAGRMHRPERHDTTSTKAANRLREALRDWMTVDDHGTSPDTLMRDIGQQWLGTVADDVRDGVLTQTTLDRYTQRMRQWVNPAIGHLRAREVTTPVINRVLRDVRGNTSAANAKIVRAVLSGLCGHAVASGAMTTNPVSESIRLTGGKQKRARALTVEEVLTIFDRLDHDAEARRQDLPDLVRFMVATGERIGEALAVRWCDIGEDTVTVARNVVRTSKGVQFHEGKSEESAATIAVPEWCTVLLRDRYKILYEAPPDDALVFPSSVGTPREQSNLGKVWGKFRQRAGFEWVKFHTFRKTVATLLDEGGLSPRQIADVLRHAHPSMTLNTYMGRGAPSRLSADVLGGMIQPPSYPPQTPGDDG